GATSLVAAPTALVANFSAPTSWPTPLAISLVDNCGAFVTNGQVTATFNNGDPPLALPLVNASKGLYSATWTPRNAASQVTVKTTATSPSGLAPATAQISGAVTPNAAPVINPQATVHAFNPQVGGPLAPGTIIAVYGANLASQVAQPASIPLATTLNGTSVIIGGIPAPLFYVSPGQINVQVPFELDPSKQYQVVVSANGAIATPQTIQMTPAVPGLAAFGDGTLIAQHQDGSLVSQTSPAQPGEYLVMYLLGMGLTSNQVPSGNASPSPPHLATPDVTPTLTLGGQPVNILFSGLTPGLVGLYQIDIQVPQNTAGGNQVLVVSQDGVSSNTTILPVQVQ
ncbi:MAG TPA: IPT/TIG domain-containing protein, partial [Bryobacteraceae bacterium]|nr:IPT/TIG domain-containing protein [Bryobacteraceae bacterium]